MSLARDNSYLLTNTKKRYHTLNINTKLDKQIFTLIQESKERESPTGIRRIASISLTVVRSPVALVLRTHTVISKAITIAIGTRTITAVTRTGKGTRTAEGRGTHTIARGVRGATRSVAEGSRAVSER